jgi:nitrite reductase/ring-hydroxylating ferredoxin subunit
VTRRLCRSDAIAEGAAREVADDRPGERGLVLVRRAGRLHAYVNSCPHLGTPLNFLPDRFLDRAGRHLLCATHGAVFRVEDGLCLSGPCRGDRLVGVPVEERDGIVITATKEAGTG